jgi:hypothetical protein
MNTGSKRGWLAASALALLMASGGAAYAQHAGGGGHAGGFGGGAHAGGFGVGGHAGFGGGFRGSVAARGYRGGYGYGGRGGYYGGRGGYYGGYYGGWPYFYGALGYGLFFGALPYAYSTYWWDGVPYYYANDNYYQWDAAANAYETVAPPSGVAAAAAQGSTPAAPAAQTELFAYPRSHQSAEQQARDRTECGQWATKQTQNHADYLRAEAACLSGRDYSVR